MVASIPSAVLHSWLDRVGTYRLSSASEQLRSNRLRRFGGQIIYINYVSYIVAVEVYLEAIEQRPFELNENTQFLSSNGRAVSRRRT